MVFISLYGNSFGGSIPSGLFSLPFVEDIDLRENQLSGHIAEFQSKSLQKIYLSNNRLHGPIPNSIFELESLSHLELSSNNLSGTVEFYMFAKLKNLENLDLSHNSLSLSTKDNVNSFFPHFSSLYLSSCNIKEFPKIISTADIYPNVPGPL